MEIKKPLYHLRDAFKHRYGQETRDSLRGIRVMDGHNIITSMIVSEDGNRIETRNTIYIVDNWRSPLGEQ